MSSPGEKIAGSKTVADWTSFRSKLNPGGDSQIWRDAARDYFHERLDLRYLKPIEVIQQNDTLKGEGFSIVAIQCTLVEFLESTIQGLNYHYRRWWRRPVPHEYSNSRNLFVKFLAKRQPFAKEFSKRLARDFYANVRCGLLHEARTKNGWMIKANSPTGSIVSTKPSVVYRNDFQNALLDLIAWYESSLTSDVILQAAFIRKFDNFFTP